MFLFHLYLKWVPVLLLWHFMWLVIVVISFTFSSCQFNILLLTSTLSYLLGFSSYIGKRFLYLSPKFSFSLVSNFAISISVFWLVAITFSQLGACSIFSVSATRWSTLMWVSIVSPLFYAFLPCFVEKELSKFEGVEVWEVFCCCCLVGFFFFFFGVFQLRQTLYCLGIFPVRWILLGWGLGIAA